MTTSAIGRIALGLGLSLGIVSVGVGQPLVSGSVAGRALDLDGVGVAGVEVSVRSPVLRAAAKATTDRRGFYVIHGLVPGDYNQSFVSAGMTTVERRARVELGRTARSDAVLEPAEIDEVLVVLARRSAAIETPSTGANLRDSIADLLAIDRRPDAVARLSAGLSERSPRSQLGQTSISGGFSWDNGVRLDGVDIGSSALAVASDTLVGAESLYIEDALRETQVLTAGSSASYGGFAGGLINAVTRSGGDGYHGSLRVDLSNARWRDETPIEEDRPNDGALVATATASGPVMADRLWFFAALRDGESVDVSQFAHSGGRYRRSTDGLRFHLSIDGLVGERHDLGLRLIESDADVSGPSLPTSVGARTIDEAASSMEAAVFSYRAAWTRTLFAELRAGSGRRSLEADRVLPGQLAAVPILSLSTDPVHYGGPWRDPRLGTSEDQSEVRGSFSLAFEAGGLHDLRVGVVAANRRLEGLGSAASTRTVLRTDYVLDAGGIGRGVGEGRPEPRFEPGRTERLDFLVPVDSRLDTETTSVFIDDRWTLTRHLQLDLGARWEDGSVDRPGPAGQIGGDRLLPRLGISIDPRADGSVRLDLGYRRYASRFHPLVFSRGSGPGGVDFRTSVYEGPPGSGFDFAPGFDRDNYRAGPGHVPSTVAHLPSNLRSPLTEEAMISAAGQVGPGGYLELSLLERRVSDLTEDFTVAGGSASHFDESRVRASSLPVREYRSVRLQGGLRLTRRWSADAHWTYQLRNHGDYEGESVLLSSSTSRLGDYPGVLSAPRSEPEGRLGSFERHRILVWSAYERRLRRAGTLAFSALYRYDSSPFLSVVAPAAPLTEAQTGAGGAFAQLPLSQFLFFGERGSVNLEHSHVADVAVRYTMPFAIEPWLKIEARNLANHRGLASVATTVAPDLDGPLDENGLWSDFVPLDGFGEPRRPEDYRAAREYRLSVGVRF